MPDVSPLFVLFKSLWCNAISMLLELLSNFSHSKRLHLAPSGLGDEAITAKFGMKPKPSTCWRIPGYLNFRVDCFAITRLRRSPNWATPTQIPWPTLQATFNCRQPGFFLLAVSWAEAGRFTSWEESRPKKVTYKANSSSYIILISFPAKLKNNEIAMYNGYGYNYQLLWIATNWYLSKSIQF